MCSMFFNYPTYHPPFWLEKRFSLYSKHPGMEFSHTKLTTDANYERNNTFYCEYVYMFRAKYEFSLCTILELHKGCFSFID